MKTNFKQFALITLSGFSCNLSFSTCATATFKSRLYAGLHGRIYYSRGYWQVKDDHGYARWY